MSNTRKVIWISKSTRTFAHQRICTSSKDKFWCSQRIASVLVWYTEVVCPWNLAPKPGTIRHHVYITEHVAKNPYSTIYALSQAVNMVYIYKVKPWISPAGNNLLSKFCVEKKNPALKKLVRTYYETYSVITYFNVKNCYTFLNLCSIFPDLV